MNRINGVIKRNASESRNPDRGTDCSNNINLETWVVEILWIHARLYNRAKSNGKFLSFLFHRYYSINIVLFFVQKCGRCRAI